MKPFGLLLAAAICVVSLAGCSSPYLPHNAVKYIPASSQQGEYETTSATEEQEGGITMKAEPLKQPQSYFSPDSIRERYAQHIKEEKCQSPDPLLDIARDSIKLMQSDNKSEKEIRYMLKEHYHFSDEIIDALLNE